MKKLKILFILFLFIFSFQNSFSQYVLEEDFETGNFPPPGWSNSGDGVLWVSDAYSAYGIGNYCASYPFYLCSNADDSMITTVFTSTGSSDSLIFDYAYAPYEANGRLFYDFLDIYTSTDSGNTYLKYLHIHCRNLTTGTGTADPYYPNTNEWGNYRTALPANVNKIKFVAVNNCANNLFLDNIKVTGPVVPYTDASVSTAYSMGRYPRTFLTNDTIAANIRNNGNQDITNLKVYMTMTGASNLTDSATIALLPGGANQIVKFKTFTPIINGNSVVKVRIAHGDENPDNDSALYNTNVNSNYFAYTDTLNNNYNGAIGAADGFYVLQKFRVTNANARITEVKVRIPGIEYGDAAVGQIIKGVVLNGAGVVAAKSDPYKIKASDLGTFVALKITDPLPYYPLTNNSYFYAGGEFGEPINYEYYAEAANQDEDPPRPNAFFWGFGIQSTGTSLTSLYELGGKYGIEAKIESMPTIDAGISSQGNLFEQYYAPLTTTAPQTGKVFNNSLTNTANATVIRKIGTGYTSSVPVTIPVNSSVNVTFANFTFAAGTTYTVRDSIVLSGDINSANNVMVGSYTPRIAKDFAIMYQKSEDRDSLIRAIISDGRYANNYDTINVNYTGSFRPWKIFFECPKSSRDFLPRVRDSLKSFLDASTPGNKKTLVVFGDRIAAGSDPSSQYFSGTPADTIFLRQYLKTKYVRDNWTANIPDSERKFKGKGFFDGITQDSVVDPQNLIYVNLCLIAPTNGGSVAFVPKSVTGTGSDSSIAVSFAGANYNTFYMSNRFSDLRSTNASPLLDGPVTVYTKIIDWMQSVNTGVKVLDLTVLLEGFYNPNVNSMIRDSVRVYLRNATNPFAIVDSSKDLLSPAGQASFIFNNTANGVNYFLQIKHRNALETWSKTAVSFISNHLNYDFTTNANKAFGDNMILSGSRYVIFEGDVNHDGSIDLNDNAIIENDAFNFESGYTVTDVNGDEIVDLNDQAIADNNGFNFVVKVTPLSAPEILARKGIVLEKYIEQNAQINSQQIPVAEIKIDNEIYDRFENTQSKNNKIPVYTVYEKSKGSKTVRSDINKFKEVTKY